MTEQTGWERASNEQRESMRQADEVLLQALTVPFDLAKISGWALDPAINHHPVARGVMRVLVSALEGERKARNLLLAGIESQVELMDALKQEARRLHKVANAARAVLADNIVVESAATQAMREAVEALDEAR